MARMPSLLRSSVVGLLACLAFVAASALAASAASAAFSDYEVTVENPKGDINFLSLDEIEVPENYGTYPIRDRNRATTSLVIDKGNGISVRQILEELKFDLDYGAVELERPNGTIVSLDSDEVVSQYSPTFYIDASGQLWFLRPSTGPNDYNAVDHFRIQSGAIRMTQTKPELEVTVEASRKKIDPGESIAFTTTVEGAPAGARYEYTWAFNDGSDQIVDGRAKETHKFTEEGKFTVLVTVKIVGTDRSDPGTVKVEVGDGQASDKDREGGGDNTTGTGTSGTATGDSGAGSTYGTDSPSTYTPVTPPEPAPVEPTDPPDVATSGTPVEGNLLADGSDPPPTNLLESAARAARDGNPSDDADGAGVPEAAISIAGVLALLGLGAGIESRQGRLPRPHLPRRAG